MQKFYLLRLLNSNALVMVPKLRPTAVFAQYDAIL